MTTNNIADRVASRAIEAAASEHKTLAAKAKDLAKAVEEIQKWAEAGKGPALDNAALKMTMYEAKFKLFAKALKAASGKG